MILVKVTTVQIYKGKEKVIYGAIMALPLLDVGFSDLFGRFWRVLANYCRFDNSLALFPYLVCFPAVGGLVGADDCVSTDILPNKNRTEEH